MGECRYPFESDESSEAAGERMDRSGAQDRRSSLGGHRQVLQSPLFPKLGSCAHCMRTDRWAPRGICALCGYRPLSFSAAECWACRILTSATDSLIYRLRR